MTRPTPATPPETTARMGANGDAVTVNGRTKRRKRAERARNEQPIRSARDPWGGMCPNGCGEPGPHFVPPSLGERGFYACPALYTTDPEES